MPFSAVPDRTSIVEAPSAYPKYKQDVIYRFVGSGACVRTQNPSNGNILTKKLFFRFFQYFRN